MKKAILLSVLLSVLLLLMVLTVMVFKYDHDSEKGTASVDADNNADIDYTAVSEDLQAIEEAMEEGDDNKAKELTRQVAKTIGSRTGRILEMASEMLMPMKVHGQLIDQYGEPVAGADIVAGYGGAAYFQGNGINDVTSDSNGMFKLAGRGSDIQIIEINHPDLSRLTLRVKTDSGYIHVHTELFESKYFNNPSRAGRTADNPYVIEMWRNERYEDVKGGAGVSIKGAPNQNIPIEFNLEFVCERVESSASAGEPGTWTARLKPVGGGGFQKAADAHLNEAPDSGYDIPYLEFGFEFGSAGYRKDIWISKQEKYYYTSRDGAVYGVFNMKYANAYYSKRLCVASFRYIKYNEGGSRNLAVRSGRDHWN